jgi:hypothetical protein
VTLDITPALGGSRGGRFSQDSHRGQPDSSDAAAHGGGANACRRGPSTFALLIPDEPRKGGADWTLDTAIPLLERAVGGPVEGIVGEEDPFEAVVSALGDPGFDEVIVSTLPRRVSEWLRRDLPHRIEKLGVPVTTVSQTEESQQVPVVPGAR